MVRLRRAKLHAQKMLKVYQVSSRFEMVGIAVMEISPAFNGFKKLLVIGDCLTRLMMSVQIKNEYSKMIAKHYPIGGSLSLDHQRDSSATEVLRWWAKLLETCADS